MTHLQHQLHQLAGSRAQHESSTARLAGLLSTFASQLSLEGEGTPGRRPPALSLTPGGLGNNYAATPMEHRASYVATPRHQAPGHAASPANHGGGCTPSNLQPACRSSSNLQPGGRSCSTLPSCRRQGEARAMARGASLSSLPRASTSSNPAKERKGMNPFQRLFKGVRRLMSGKKRKGSRKGGCEHAEEAMGCQGYMEGYIVDCSGGYGGVQEGCGGGRKYGEGAVKVGREGLYGVPSDGSLRLRRREERGEVVRSEGREDVVRCEERYRPGLRHSTSERELVRGPGGRL